LINFEEIYASLILDLRLLLLLLLMTIGIPALGGCLGDLRLLWTHLATVQGGLTPLDGQIRLFGGVVIPCRLLKVPTLDHLLLRRGLDPRGINLPHSLVLFCQVQILLGGFQGGS
jgi:hypothetical protein